MVAVHCEWCDKEQDIRPSRVPKYRFCSIACRNEWRAKNWTQENNPKWIGGVREKTCEHCGKPFKKRRREAQCVFEERKFCSPECVVSGQHRIRGPEHHLWKPIPRRDERRGRQSAWSRAVLARDNNTCQRCGKTGGRMHAHHIEPISETREPGKFKGDREADWTLESGITLCPKCHFAEHAALRAKRVKSGNVPPANLEPRTIPSQS